MKNFSDLTAGQDRRFADRRRRSHRHFREVILAYKTKQESISAAAAAEYAAKLRLAEAEEKTQLAKKAAAEAETAREAASNAGALKLAEARKMAADAETARAAADNAAKLKIAEAEKETQLAKKAAADAEKSAADAKTAAAIAENSKRRQEAEAASAEAKARYDTADANIQEYVNDVLERSRQSGKSLATEMTNAVMPQGLRGRRPPTANEAPANQIPPKCRQGYASWQEPCLL